VSLYENSFGKTAVISNIKKVILEGFFKNL
jgi:hypothetical protein